MKIDGRIQNVDFILRRRKCSLPESRTSRGLLGDGRDWRARRAHTIAVNVLSVDILNIVEGGAVLATSVTLLQFVELDFWTGVISLLSQYMKSPRGDILACNFSMRPIVCCDHVGCSPGTSECNDIKTRRKVYRR